MPKSALTCLLIFIAGFLFPFSVQAQTVRANVDRTRVSLDEAVRLTVTIADAKGSVDTRSIKDFNTISEGTSTSIRIVNGRTSRETMVSFSLLPRKDGRLVIPSLPVTVGTKVHHTREITIVVTKEPPSDASRRDIFVTAEVSKADPYVGEQITYFLRLYHAVRIADPSVQDLPDFEGFSAKPLENREGYRATRNGREYIVQELRFVLVPLSAGKKSIPPALISLDISIRHSGSRRRGLDRFFDDPFFGGGRRETRRFRPEALTVNVLPLPADEQSSLPFSGLVGQFKIETNLVKYQLAVGDAATLEVTLTGIGNPMDAVLPEMQIPQGLKTYADAPEESIELTENGYKGKKAFRIALVGISPGTYTIGPVRIRYFDPLEKSYATLSTGPATIRVTPSTENETFKVASGTEPDPSATSRKEKVEFTGRDILPLKEDLGALERRNPMGLPLFLLFLGIPVLICLGAWCFKKASRQNKDPATLMAKRAEAALKEAAGNPDNGFLSSLSRALISAILSRAGNKGEALTYREAEEILVSTGLNPDLARAAGALLDRIDSGQYGGKTIDTSGRQALLHETRSMIKQVMKS